jgi:hypothetical protein
MSVRIGSPDTFAYVVGVYVCRCGRTAEQHGLHVGDMPPGWVRIAGDGDEPDHACPVCAAWAQAQLSTS